MSVYTENGYTSRRDYLVSIADDMGIDESTVFAMADILGPNEDFDGLVCELEDFVAMDIIERPLFRGVA